MPDRSDPPIPSHRVSPDILSVLAVYALVLLGTYIIARQVLGQAPDFPNLEGRLPMAVLAVLPLTLTILFLVRARNLASDLRARRYGALLRLRLSLLFLLAVAAASVPQGLFLIRLAVRAQSSSSSEEVRAALSSGTALALSWYDEELARLRRLAEAVVSGKPDDAARADGGAALSDAELLLDRLRSREPSIEAVEVFVGAKSVDFAGNEAARFSGTIPALAPGMSGQFLPAASSGGVNRLRYAAAWRPSGRKEVAVLTLRLPENLERSAELLGRASATAELLVPFSRRWSELLALLYAFLVAPLLLLAVLLGLAAADLVAEPLASLHDATRRVAEGDFGVRLIVKKGDETGRLVASFNRMLDDIQRSRSVELRKEKIDAWKDIAQRLAHELKNPLTPIRLAAERVLRRWKSDPRQALEILETSMIAIVKEVEGMDALLSDFRAFASLPEPQPDWVDLRLLVEETVALYSASYPDILFSLGGVPPGLSLRIDRAAMKRALGNLIANSVDAMEGRGKVEFDADLVKAADSRYCRLRIKDSGRGIPPSIGDRIFVPYFTTKSFGTGLGLSIVERIVADHGGEIRFESEEGAGATFFIDLPLDR
ncbi:MAG TPA: ATP-binding protein [Rectinemataceae bacterium]|nr:ATP-binding protein [Rectinemataceae bacterium]